MKTKYDYDLLKHEYVTTKDLSIRELCRRHDIATWSTVAARAKRESWDDVRERYRALEESKTIEIAARRRAEKLTAIGLDLLEALHASVIKMGIDLQDRWVDDPETGKRHFVPGTRVTPDHLVKLIEKYQLIIGEPTSREANLGLNVHADAADIPTDVLRELAALARGKGAGSGSVGQPALPSLEGARKVN